jgi:hypothetical protein
MTESDIDNIKEQGRLSAYANISFVWCIVLIVKLVLLI